MRAIRRSLQVVALVGTILVGLVAVALIVSQTPWFRDWLRRYVVRESKQYLNGELSIGRLDGNLVFGVQLSDVAVDVSGERVVALVGRSLTRNVATASNLMDPDTGRPYLSPPAGTLVRLRELEEHPRDEQVLICTGSQGEPMAALSRIARGEHNHVTIEPGDTVLYSSSTVPGNELAVNEIVNRLVRADANFITEPNQGGSTILRWEIQNPVDPGKGGVLRFRTRVR